MNIPGRLSPDTVLVRLVLDGTAGAPVAVLVVIVEAPDGVTTPVIAAGLVLAPVPPALSHGFGGLPTLLDMDSSTTLSVSDGLAGCLCRFCKVGKNLPDESNVTRGLGK